VEARPCAGITSYKGVQETATRLGEWIAISGAGGLGHQAIQYAKVMGLRVCTIDIDDGKFAHAMRLGVDRVIDAKVGDLAATAKSTWRSGYGTVAHRIQAGRRQDSKAQDLRLGRVADGRIPRPALRLGRETRNHPRFSSVRAKDKVKAEALVFAAHGKVKADIKLQPLYIDQPDLRAARAWQCCVVVLEFAIN